MSIIPANIKTKAQENPLILLQAAVSLMDEEKISNQPSQSNEADPFPVKKRVKLSSNHETSREQDINAFRTAAATGDLETLDKLLNVNQIHPGVCNNIAVIEAAKNGHLHICKRLLQDPRTNPTDQRNYAIRMAVRNGHIEILALFLEHSKADPSADNNYAIRVASIGGHVEIVKLLLKDSRVDPTVKDYYPVRYASKNNHWDIVDLILSDSRVNLKRALDASRKNGRLFQPLIEKIESLLRHYKSPQRLSIQNPISPVSDNPTSPVRDTISDLVLYASQGQKSKIETVVKEYKSTIVQAIIASAESGHADVLKYLVKEFPVLDISESDSIILQTAIRKHTFSQNKSVDSIK